MEQRSWINIDLKSFSENINELKRFLLPEQGFLQVVKADAYGHGAVQIAKIAIEHGAVMLGVANVEEGIYLRYRGIDAPILILSPSLHTEIKSIIDYDLIPCVSDLSFCHELNQQAKDKQTTVSVHVKINTGMNRNGLKENELSDFFNNFYLFEQLKITGLFSHFAASDDDESFSLEQETNFIKIINLFKESKYNTINNYLKYIHISNSCGLITHNNPVMNLVRFGIMSYGYYLNNDFKAVLKLTPVMSFKSKISHINYAKKGETIGYNRTYRAEADIKYAIIPVGYADGYDFLLSNKAYVMVKNQLSPILGKVSMDMICIDISNVDNVELNDEIKLLGKEPEINAATLTKIYNGSIYELLCQLGRRAKRFYYYKGSLIDDEPLQRRSFVPIDFNDDKLNRIIQQAIAQRVDNYEISSVIYEDILKHIFKDSDKDIKYRSNFKHNITFIDTNNPDFYKVKTTLSFDKILQNDEFTVACANDIDNLKYFFKKDNCEYRWLLDKNISLTDNKFSVTKMILSSKKINYITETENSCIIYRFNDIVLKELVGTEVSFLIETETYYPKNSHQLSIYINEITKGVEISFTYPITLGKVESSIIFSGNERFPSITESISNDYKTLQIKTNKYVFPSSGVVFSF